MEYYVGELPVETAHNSMFTTEFQRMEPIEWTLEGEELLRDLMGEDVTPRKNFVFNKIDFTTIRE